MGQVMLTQILEKMLTAGCYEVEMKSRSSLTVIAEVVREVWHMLWCEIGLDLIRGSGRWPVALGR